MNNLPRLELTEDPNKKTEYIIYRHPINDKKVKPTKTVTRKQREYNTRKHGTRKKKNSKSSKSKSLFNIF
jgi:hypothetical protein